ncbi:MAG: biopolymer transporter TolR [Bacteroidota bacterium]
MGNVCFFNILFFGLVIGFGNAQNTDGLFDHFVDVGPVLHGGSTFYDRGTQIYELSGSGTNIWFAKDEFHFAHKKLKGDFILRTRARFIGEGVDPHRKLGWMVRTSLDPTSAMVCATVHGDGLTAIQYRKKRGTHVAEVRSPVKAPDIIQLERLGNRFFLGIAKFGAPFWKVEVTDLEFPEELLGGLFICSHNAEVMERAIFENTRILYPAPADLVPYRDYLGSHLEVLEVDTGKREMVYSSEKSIQAPNWTADNKALLYNSEGRIYRLDLTDRTTTVVPTDFVQDNNNDHVLSFDGSMLGLSSSSGEREHGSLIYTVPAKGGIPKRITPTGPSYLHGWSPDGKWLTYTASRTGIYNIYKIPSDGGGPEVQLTDEPALDDGSEFGPDGRYIYFNSARTGSMELWRMLADGSDQEQLTDDAYQNWFPHVSPDGQEIVFLSYLPEVGAQEHPFYQHVYLRKIPIDGGEPKIVAYLYGGQGTINVPSWSPDGKYVAFVSNSGIK